ncbi:MAG: BrxA family protein [Synechococcaceae cyanobacterium]
MPRPAPQASRYCLSFTAAGLKPELAAVIAGIHLEEQGDWARTKAAVLERNALQARSASTGKRLESELRQRLQCLNTPQVQLLALGTSDERSAMAWLAVLKRIQIAADLTREVLLVKLSSLDPVLRRSDMTAFYENCEREHPELAALAASSQQKVRSALLQMLRDAGLLVGKPGKGGTLGSVQRPLVSPQVQAVLEDDDPSLLVGFLLSPAARQHKAGQPKGTKLRPPTKPGSKPTRKPATKPAGQAAAKAAPGTPPKPVIKRTTSPARRQSSCAGSAASTRACWRCSPARVSC